MGQLLGMPTGEKSGAVTKFCDLKLLPPEIALAILAKLDATDLCLAGCVWDDLAKADILWLGLCRGTWGYVTCYRNMPPGLTYRQLYLVLDDATLSFKHDAFEGINYMINKGLLTDDCMEIAKFLHRSKKLDSVQLKRFLAKRPDVLQCIVDLQSFENQFLPNALRMFFGLVEAPDTRGEYLSAILEQFSRKFCRCNPTLGLPWETVYILCYSLILLSVDLCSPHVKNKMSKREFIRNTRGAAPIDDDLAGHLYDNVYLIGHIAPSAS